MKLVTMNKKELKNAQTFTDWSCTSVQDDAAEYGFTVEEPVLNVDVANMLKSHATAGSAGKRPKLFWTGSDPQTVVDSIMGADSSGRSELSQHFDDALVKKVGPQGYTFPAAYLYQMGVREYFPAAQRQPNIESDVLVASAYQEATRRFVESVLNGNGGKKLKPLTWAEAVEVTCSKDTAAWDMGGSKQHPAVRLYLMEHPYQHGTGDCVGQRYQRNKMLDGKPLPRVTFNAHVSDVAVANLFLVPLTRALQQDVLQNGNWESPYTELCGPDAVGVSINKWWESRPMNYYGIMGDVQGMDQCYTRCHMDFFCRALARVFEFDDEGATYQLLQESLDHCFTGDLTLDDKHVLRGVTTSMRSGKGWTHIAESFTTDATEIAFCASFRFTLKDDSKKTIRGTSEWKVPLRHAGGDDAAVCIAIPSEPVICSTYFDRAGWTSSGDFSLDIKSLYVRVYELFALRARTDKQDVYRNAVSFCSKVYSLKARGPASVAGNAGMQRPVYSPIQAINGILFPEHTPTSARFEAEITRVFQITDQVYGHERWATLVASLVKSMAPEHRLLLVDMAVSDMSVFDSDMQPGEDTWTTYTRGIWRAVTSPSFAEAVRIIRATVNHNDSSAREIRALVSTLRRAVWKFHIDSVSDPLLADILSDDTLQDDDSPLLQRLIDRATHTVDGNAVSERNVTEWGQFVPWSVAIASDHPARDFAKQNKKTSARAESIIKPSRSYDLLDLDF